MRVAVAGAAGGVGSAAAFALALGDHAAELLLLDARRGPLAAQAMDLEQLRGSVREFAVRTAGWEDALAADVLIFAASVPHRDGLSRLDYLRENTRIVLELAAAAQRAGRLPRVVVATNPVDQLCTLLHRRLRCPRGRILGFTANDSLRLRFAIGRRLGVPPARVEAWSLGEHGEHAVPLLDRVRVDGRTVALDEPARAAVRAYTDGWYGRWQACGPGRTSAWMSGQGLAALVGHLAKGRDEPYPASVLLDGEYGCAGVSLTVPARIGAEGVEVLEWPLAAADADRLRMAAQAVGASTPT